MVGREAARPSSGWRMRGHRANQVRTQAGRIASARWIVVLGVVAIVAVAALVVANATGSDDADADAQSVGHVHGLAIDPSDGALHVATHNGLYRMAGDGLVERVSFDRHDFMGFTIDDADRFLASGHPAIGTAAFRVLDRPLFGLIESTDGGRSWQPVSLSGEVDFHGLEAVHGNVYGFDSTSGRVLVSTDGGIEWEERSSILIADLAVDPVNEDRIVASTADGLTESTDGGRGWKPLQAPAMVYLDWHAERGLWGLDSEGTVHHLRGGAWKPVAELAGHPGALLVHDGGVVVAVEDGSTAIYTSEDGQGWEALYRDTGD